MDGRMACELESPESANSLSGLSIGQHSCLQFSTFRICRKAREISGQPARIIAVGWQGVQPGEEEG
jgi:hypothetical protein